MFFRVWLSVSFDQNLYSQAVFCDLQIPKVQVNRWPLQRDHLILHLHPIPPHQVTCMHSCIKFQTCSIIRFENSHPTITKFQKFVFFVINWPVLFKNVSWMQLFFFIFILVNCTVWEHCILHTPLQSVKGNSLLGSIWRMIDSAICEGSYEPG